MRDSICAIGAQPIVCDVERIIKSCRALEVDSQMQICYEQKMALQLMDLFKLRAWLHKFVYQHHTVNVIEEMICDVLTAANDHLRCITDRNGLQRRLSDAVEDEEAFCHLGDWILNLIEASHDPSLRKAQTILHRLRSRKLYYALHVPLKVENHLRAEVVAEEILSYLPSQRARELREELLIHFTYIDFGRRDKTGKATDPIDDVRFFNPKEGVMVARSIASRPKCDLLMPRAFSERLMYVYSRSDDAWDDLRQAFQQWRQHLGTSQRNVSSKLTAPISTGNQASPQKAAIRIQRSMSRDMRQHGIKLRHYKSI